MKKIVLATIVVVSFLGLVFLIKQRQTNLVDPNKLQITTSFYPLYFMAIQIGGDKVQVVNLTPVGAEPHDYEPTTSDLQRIENSKILILSGQMETWGEKIRQMLKNKNIDILDTGEGLVIGGDPHVWIDPILAQKMVDKIASSFAKSDPENKSTYEENAKKLKLKLSILDNEFKKGLVNCNNKNVVTSHSAFGYLGKRYGFKQISISGLNPDEEPSVKQIASLVDFVKANKIKYVFFETLVSPRLAQTLANETTAATLNFDPIEGLSNEAQNRGEDYFSIQKNNLENLKIAMECK